MGSKWSDLSGSSGAYPSNGPQRSAVQLSDGTLVFIDYSGSSYYLKYWARSGSPTTIATLSASLSNQPALCRDASNNLYVVGAPSAGHVALQGFAKGSGYTWTAETLQTISLGYSSAYINPVQLTWCNTGGGTGGSGHLLVTAWWYVSSSSTGAGAVVADAGALLAGSSPTTSSSYFISQGAVSFFVASASDGFGATSGLTFWSFADAGFIDAEEWAVNSSGVLNFAGVTGSVPTVLSPGGFTCGRVGSGQWMVVYPKSDGSGNFAATYVTTSGFGATGYTNGPGNWPSYNSSVAGYDLYVDPTTAGQVWAIAPGAVSSGSLPVYRLACTLNGSNTPVWSTSVVLDDTLTAYAFPSVNIVAVRDPVISTVDWILGAQTAATPTYAVLGDYSVLAQTPSSTLTSPSNGQYVDALATSGPSLLAPAWTYNNIDGSVQAAWAFRYKVSGGGSYLYWNVSTGAGQSTIVWNAGSTSSWTPPSGIFSNGSTNNWSAAVESSFGLQGSFATDYTFVCQAAPTVSITAPSGGTQSTSQPTVTYTTTSAGGTSLISYRIMIYPASVASGGGFSPGLTAGAVWDTGVVTGAPPGGGVTVPAANALANETSYVVCMQVTETGNESSTWAQGSPFLCAYNLPPSPTVTAVSGTDTNSVPAVVLTINEGSSGSGSSSTFGGLMGLSLMGAFLMGGGGGLGGGSTTDTNYTVTVTYTDAYGSGTLRYGNTVALTPGTPLTVYDYEATAGTLRTYTVTVTALASGVVVTSLPGTATATLSISSWWFIDPVTPSASIAMAVSDATGLQHYNAAAHYPIVDASVSTPTPPAVITGGFNGQDGQLTVEMNSPAQWQAFRSCVQSGSVKWLIDPFGDGIYAKVGLANPIAGQSGAAHQTTFTQSPTNQPLRSSVVTYIEVSAP